MALIHNNLLKIIEKQQEKEKNIDIWKDSCYKDLVKLQNNNVGIVGEELINSICKVAKIDADCNGGKTKKIGGSGEDGKIMGVSVEIKTACQSSKSCVFQHELGEEPWKCSKYMIFIDISPSCIYLTIFDNLSESIYKSKEKLVCFPTKSITWRKRIGAFKLDTSVKINEQNIIDNNTIKITKDTKNKTVASFIKNKIKTEIVPETKHLV